MTSSWFSLIHTEEVSSALKCCASREDSVTKHDSPFGAQLPYNGFCNEEEARGICTNGRNSGKRWGRAECCWEEPTLICSTPCAGSDVVWHYLSEIYTRRFELPPVQINACPGAESTRFWQENNFRRDHLADILRKIPNLWFWQVTKRTSILTEVWTNKTFVTGRRSTLDRCANIRYIVVGLHFGLRWLSSER